MREAWRGARWRLVVLAFVTLSADAVGQLSAGAPYILVPAGSFLMGCVPADSLCGAGEKPRHRVRISHAFWLGTTEVTVGQFREFERASGYRSEAELAGRGRMATHASGEWRWVSGLSWSHPLHPDSTAPDDWPAVQVSVRDAEAYCAWDGGRLPTEAEWERAARGAVEGERALWGNAPIPLNGSRRYANGPDESMKRVFPRWEAYRGYDDGHSALAPVGRFAPNRLGLFDMAGNAYEWTADEYDSTYYARSPAVDPRNASQGEGRTVRGGGWGYYPSHLRLSFRGVFESDGFWTATLGFRCVRMARPMLLSGDQRGYPSCDGSRAPSQPTGSAPPAGSLGTDRGTGGGGPAAGGRAARGETEHQPTQPVGSHSRPR
jgi:formylglycine-generating enzyme required for sulfatase activity